MRANAGDMNDFKQACKLLCKSIGLFFLVMLRLCEMFFLALKKMINDNAKKHKQTKKSKKKPNFFEEYPFI